MLTYVHTQIILCTLPVVIHAECVPVALIVISSPARVAISSWPVSLSLHLQSLDVIGTPAGQSVSCCVLLFIHTRMLWSQFACSADEHQKVLKDINMNNTELLYSAGVIRHYFVTKIKGLKSGASFEK